MRRTLLMALAVLALLTAAMVRTPAALIVALVVAILALAAVMRTGS